MSKLPSGWSVRTLLCNDWVRILASCGARRHGRCLMKGTQHLKNAPHPSGRPPLIPARSGGFAGPGSGPLPNVKKAWGSSAPLKPAGCWWLPRGAGVWPPDAGCLCSHGFSSQPLVTPHRRGLCLSRQTRPGPAGFHRGTAGAARTAFSLSCSRAEPGAHESSVPWAHGFLSPLQGWAVVPMGDRLFSHVLFTRILWERAQGRHA